MRTKLFYLVFVVVLSGCSFLVNKVDDPVLKHGLLVDIGNETIAASEEDVEIQVSSLKNMANFSEELRELLQGRQKVISFSYFDFDDTNDVFHVMGSNVKVELKKKLLTAKRTYDTVVMDLENGTTFGYCQDMGVCDVNEREVYYIVSYDGYNNAKNPILVPDTWVRANFTAGSWLLGRTLVREVSFTDDQGRNGTALLDNYYGVPYKITYSDGKSFEFKDLKINAPLPEDVQLPPERHIYGLPDNTGKVKVIGSP